jgi:hypothetical protein
MLLFNARESKMMFQYVGAFVLKEFLSYTLGGYSSLQLGVAVLCGDSQAT